MNEEAQRIAIAEACPSAVEWHDDIPYWKGSYSSVGEGNEWYAEFRPLTDLNAMHEAAMVLEHSMSKLDYTAYLDELIGLVCANPAHPSGYATAVDATARQRAEAFLRTLGLWVGE